ncbi:MAG: hypothetical protein JNK76_26870 [Planctomycetales bacterium]|nr:hypothetical protein [Planctomycetales bacterium]
MERQELEVFADAPNFAIVRMPGRSFPGCVVQGDSLCILLHRVQEARAMAKDTNNQELLESVAEIETMLTDRLDHYESVLKANGLRIPYTR